MDEALQTNPIKRNKDRTIICQHCGSTNSEWSKYCNKCGFSQVATISTSSQNLKYIPSYESDFTKRHYGTIKILFVNVYQSRSGSWYITGQIQNTGNETLNFIKPHAQLFDESGQLVGLIMGFTRNVHLC
jgi:ribosomal protein L37E